MLCLQSASALTTAVRAARAHGPLLGALAAVGDRAPFPTAVHDALARGANGAFTTALLVAAFAAPVRKALAGRAPRAPGAALLVAAFAAPVCDALAVRAVCAPGAARVVTPLACAPPFAYREERMADGGGEGMVSRREKDVPVASDLEWGVCVGGREDALRSVVRPC